jgi:ABC-type lipoprotein release transport system permease subunit
MTFLRLLGRNLLYHWRGNLAVFLGVALGTAVLTGALLVGDSLYGSLRDLTLDRLGWVEQAMLPGRFFRADLADDIGFPRSSPAIMLSGSASWGASGTAKRRAGGVTVLGVDERFWGPTRPADASFWPSDSPEVVLNQALAELLGAREGNTVTLHLPRPDEIPREALLGKRKASDVMQSLELKVRRVLPDDFVLARFTLKQNPEAPRNAYVPLRLLQSELGLAGQANAILVGQSAPTPAPAPPIDLAALLRQKLRLEDWGLRLRTPKDRALAFVHYLAPHEEEGKLKRARWRGRVPDALAEAAEENGGILTRDQVVAFYKKYRPYISLESRQLFLPPVAVEAGHAAARGSSGGHSSRKVAVQSILVYLVDTMTIGDRSLPYVVVAGVDETKITGLRNAGVWLDDTRIAIAYPPDEADKVAEGEPVDLAYYAVDAQQHLDMKHAAFDVLTTITLRGPADDPDLTPEFPGITDKLDMGEWQNPPFPYDRKRITKVEEDYWQRYRATPRAYISLRRAQELWGSRFGNLTSMQFFGADAQELTAALLANLPPERGGFVFQPVRANAARASSGAAEFGWYFLAFSSFLIVSALLLVGLLQRLNLDRRASEIGLLLAIGWSHARVRWLLLGEGTVLAAAGGIVGLAGALLYARLMLDLLRANWPAGDSLGFLRLHVDHHSIVHGYVGALAMSVLTILWAIRVLGKVSPRALLAGVITPERSAARSGRFPWSTCIVVVAALGAAAAVVAGFFAQGQEARAGSFFASGALVLVAWLAEVWTWLRRTGRQSTPRPSLTALGIRNAGRHAVRSLLTVGLLAAATFLIVAVESFHKDVGADFLAPTGGSGGFALIAETDVPIFQDLNDAAVRKQFGLTDPLLARVRVHGCRVRGGDDASCLNLYSPLAPRVVGVPRSALGDRFHFSAAQPQSEPEAQDPWLLLDRPVADGTVPAVVDATTAEYGLHKKLDDPFPVTNERGEQVPLRIVGLLAESIFQSEIVVSEVDFQRLFPRQEGYSMFLVECPDCSGEEVERVQAALETALAEQGVRVQTAASRLQAYLAVENMYLATFQALGGLGLVLGAIGLAIILLRGVWERRGELALLRALGFSAARLAWLVLAENLALLLLGLAAGTVAALVAVAPHLTGAEASGLALRIGILLLCVLATGLIAGAVAVFTTVRAPLLTTLRRE